MTTPTGPSGVPDPKLPAWFRKQTVADPMSDERLAAFIGPRWTTYARKFAPFREDPSFVPTWNWTAALFQVAWFAYRKLYLAALGFWVIPGLVFRALSGSDAQLTMSELMKPENEHVLMMQFGVALSSMILSGGIANWLLFRRARAAVHIAALQESGAPEQLSWLARVGGVNRRGTTFAVLILLMLTYAAVRS